MLLECRDELKFTPRALILLIGTQLVEMKELDNFLCKVPLLQIAIPCLHVNVNMLTLYTSSGSKYCM